MTTRRRTLTLALACTALLAAAAGAQHSPYVEHTDRDIKALSAQEIDDLLHGRGMGLALAAELNGYPGPKHVLELAGELELSAEQRAAVARVHQAMETQAIDLGRRTVDAEGRLDALFAGGEATSEALRTALDEIAGLTAALRHAHLDAHLATKAVLSEEQVRRYDELRGYAAGEAAGHGHHGHRHD